MALITDAGTPGISDPGEELVRICQESGIRVTSLPGPAACVTALSMSGLPARRFAFEAFLPREKKEREQILASLKQETRTIILYEAPHHLLKTLEELYKTLGNRSITICRELTKKYETVFISTISGAISYYQKEAPRGEFVLVIQGRSFQELQKEQQENWNALTLEEHMNHYESQGISRKEAMKLVAKDRGVSKREIYGKLLEDS